MAAIDRFIEVTQRQGGERLVLAAGEQVLLVCGNETRTLTAQPVNVTQVEDLLCEIVPPELASAASRDGYQEWVYDSPFGAVQVRMQRTRDSLRALLEPAAYAPAPAPVPVRRPETERPSGHTANAAPAPAPANSAATSNGAAPPVSGSQRLHELLDRMVQHRCSDLHLSAGSPPLFRKDGEIVPIGDKTPLSSDTIRTYIADIVPPRNLAAFEATHDTDFAYEMSEEARFRANLFRDRRGIGAVFRFIPGRIPSVRELGLSKPILDLCDLSKGLVLITGPTGSGKSTTLAAMIDYINAKRSAHIITIEDPIEFVHANRRCLVNQREVGLHTDGFKTALRAALREDPDILLVGEMRDLETMEIAIETAETGHLVFGTLHTNTAASAVDRIIDQFPSDRQAQIRTMLADSLRGVIAQTLCKKRGGGLVAAMEYLAVNSAASNLIREAKTFQLATVMQSNKAAGMVTLNDALLELVRSGLVEVEHAIAKSVNKTEFRAQLERQGVRVPAASREPAGTML